MYSPLSHTHPLTQQHPYKLRLNLDVVAHDYIVALENFSKTLKGSFIFAEEVGKKTGKPHVHGAFWFPTKRAETLKTKLKKFLTFVNEKRLTNNDWSVVLDDKPDTWRRYEWYCCKEEKVFLTSYTPEEVIEFRDNAHRVYRELISAQRADINKNQKKKICDRETHYKNIVKTITAMSKEYVETDWYETDEIYNFPKVKFQLSKDEAIRIILEEYSDEFFTISQLECVVNRVMMTFSPERWKNVLANKLSERFS